MARTKDVLDDLAEWYGVPAGATAADDRASAPRWYRALPEVRLRSAVRPGLARLAQRLLAWNDRTRERRELMELSDEMLRDLGLPSAAESRQAARPFWRS
jgi:uncharacterized protein YjiS (DUF1127 family)